MTLTYVRWLDASYQRGECCEHELCEEVYLHTAGILVRETDRVVSVAMDRYDAEGTWRHIQHIPKGMIVGRKDVVLEVEGP